MQNMLALSLSLSLLGKVHGSLARAGKVRGQTPKVGGGTQKIVSSWSILSLSPPLPSSPFQVDPQEKKKKKTGRAKRRMQYNRRFVNVVATFGRRRGPNSNAPWTPQAAELYHVIINFC